jgi:4-hydroxybenzoate polyprenyltransferase/phosphoserine phosphatase
MALPATEQKSVPLCVDLDGTLIRSDLLWESMLRLVRLNPFWALMLPIWLTRGRAFLKRQIADRVTVDPVTLPYNNEILAFLRDQKAAGRQLYLVTASDTELAESVQRHVGLFDEVIASNGKTNLRGVAKGTVLVERFGEKGFDYAGNSHVDLAVWSRARHAIVANAGPSLVSRAGRLAKVERVFEPEQRPFFAWMKALRPHQWIKNIILFVPLITAHQVGDALLLLKSGLAFVALSLCASATYLLNDLLDLESDRRHSIKHSRPFASGALAPQHGLAAIPLLLVCGGALAAGLGWGFTACIALYMLVTSAYSWWLKAVPLVDVFCLAGLYTLRLIGGHEATGVAYSFWLLVFSMFIFLSLALIKRFQELDAAQQQNRSAIHGRGYAARDLQLIGTLGPACGCLAVLVMALYVNSQEVVRLYRRPMLLLLICPLLLFWISRVWMLAFRGRMPDDPVVHALKDPASYIVGALTLVVIWLATV